MYALCFFHLLCVIKKRNHAVFCIVKQFAFNCNRNCFTERFWLKEKYQKSNIKKARQGSKPCLVCALCFFTLTDP